MKNLINKYFLQCSSLLLMMTITSCEETDVCDQPTSPRLKIVFRDTQGNPITINGLHVYRDENKTPEFKISNQDSLDIALNADKDTVLKFRRVEGEPQGKVVIKSGKKERQYISIACGFKILHKEVTYELQADSNDEIQDKKALTNEIVNENEPHLALIWQNRETDAPTR